MVEYRARPARSRLGLDRHQPGRRRRPDGLPHSRPRWQHLVVACRLAARGRQHLLIEKSHQGLVTRTSVQTLDEARRREEIARMLSGAQVTDEARAQASRLLEAA